MAVVTGTMQKAELPDIIYQEAFYSNEDDVPNRQREYAGREFKLESATVPLLPDFDPTGISPATFGRKAPILIDQAAEERTDSKRRRWCKILYWSIAEQPPSKAQVVAWLEEERRNSVAPHIGIPDSLPRKRLALSQIDDPTPRNKHGFKYSQKQASTSVQHETQYMSLMSLEVHVNTRGKLAPNPEYDEVECIFWCVQSDGEDIEINGDRGLEF